MTQILPHQPLNAYKVGGTRGHTEPRIFTPPLRELTRETSYGFDVIDFARDVVQRPLTPWQEWFVIHAGELLEDGRPRFRKVLGLLSRQNGKTELLKVLANFWLFAQYKQCQEILGLSTNRESAKLAWEQTLKLARNSHVLEPLITNVKKGNNDTYFETVLGSLYRIRAANDGAARGLTIDRLIIDELRQQKKFDAWDAVMPTMAARPFAQAVCISNAGDDTSVVLNKLHEEALEFIASGTGDYRTGLFEWSAAPGDDITSPETWAKANPNMGYIFTEDELRGDAISALNLGGEVLAGFKTERLCMRVSSMDSAIDPDRWAQCEDNTLTLAEIDKSKLSYFFDVSLNQTHATLCAAYKFDDTVRIEVVNEWRDANAMRSIVRDIKALSVKHKIRRLGYFPIGPAAAFATQLKALKVPGLALEQITGEVSDSCMGLADEVFGRRISHEGNALLTAQIIAVAKKWTADRWKFSRSGAGTCDAAYAAAGAWNLAVSLPPAKDFFVRTPNQKEGG